MKEYKVKNGECILQVFASKTESDITLLFLHDVGVGAHEMMKHEAIQTLIKEYRCVFFNQRGCGQSIDHLANDITYQDVVSDIKAVGEDIRKRFDTKKLVLCGELMGGFIALLIMRDFLHFFDGLILISPILLVNREKSLHFFSYMKEHCLKYGDKELHKLVTLLADNTPEQFFANKHVRLYCTSNRNISLQLAHVCYMGSWIFSTPCIDILKQITFPALIMQGSMERIRIEGEILDELIRLKNPFIEYGSFPYSNNSIYAEQPFEFIKRIERYIQEEFAS